MSSDSLSTVPLVNQHSPRDSNGGSGVCGLQNAEEGVCFGSNNTSPKTTTPASSLLNRIRLQTFDKLPIYLQRRIAADFFLTKSHFIQFAFVIILIAYIQTVWARTTAFYRHKQIADYVSNSSDVLEHRLKDMGYEVFPDWATNDVALHLNETCQYFTGLWLVLLMVYPYVYDTMVYLRFRKEDNINNNGGEDTIVVRKYNPFDYSPVRSVSIAIRFALCLAMVETLRMPCYLVTSLPGPSAHCIGPAAAADRPKHYSEVFYQPRTGENCGDLIFSGHISFLMTATMTATYYFPRLAVNRRNGRYFSLTTLLVILVQIILILCTRSHYSVDLVVGLIVGFLAWQMDRYVLRPRDRTPPGYPHAYQFTTSSKNVRMRELYNNNNNNASTSATNGNLTTCANISIANGTEYKMWSLVRIVDSDEDEDDVFSTTSGRQFREYTSPLASPIET